MSNVDAAFRVIDPRSKKSIFHIWRIEVKCFINRNYFIFKLICKNICVDKLETEAWHSLRHNRLHDYTGLIIQCTIIRKVWSMVFNKLVWNLCTCTFNTLFVDINLKTKYRYKGSSYVGIMMRDRYMNTNGYDYFLNPVINQWKS